MKLNIFIVTALVLIITGLPCLSTAGMSSASYAIPTSVMSGGGVPMSSGSFQNNATLGQSSPLALTPVSSTSHDLYAGFWHTMSISSCIWDLDTDGDVDGSDLNLFIHPPYNTPDIENFGLEFGRTDCL